MPTIVHLVVVPLETRAGIWLYDANKKDQLFSPAECSATGMRNGEGFAFDAAGRLFVTHMAATSCHKIARASKRGSRSGWFRSNSIKIDSAIQPTPRTCLKTLPTPHSQPGRESLG